jgi:hypothetical protein
MSALIYKSLLLLPVAEIRLYVWRIAPLHQCQKRASSLHVKHRRNFDEVDIENFIVLCKGIVGFTYLVENQ